MKTRKALGIERRGGQECPPSLSLSLVEVVRARGVVGGDAGERGKIGGVDGGLAAFGELQEAFDEGEGLGGDEELVLMERYPVWWDGTRYCQSAYLVIPFGHDNDLTQGS